MLNVIVNTLVNKSQLQSVVTYSNAFYIHLKKLHLTLNSLVKVYSISLVSFQ